MAKKLGIAAGHRVGLFGEPEPFIASLEPLPEGVRLVRGARSPVDVIVAFFDRQARLEARMPRLLGLLRANGGLWLAWPKKSASLPTNLDFAIVQRTGLATGLVDNKVCAIDHNWSGLRFVVRKENRKQWPVP